VAKIDDIPYSEELQETFMWQAIHSQVPPLESNMREGQDMVHAEDMFREHFDYVVFPLHSRARWHIKHAVSQG